MCRLGAEFVLVVIQLDIVGVDQNSAIGLRPFQVNVTDPDSMAIPSLRQRALDIILEDAKGQRSACESESQKPGDDHDEQDQSAKYFQNNRRGGLANQGHAP